MILQELGIASLAQLEFEDVRKFNEQVREEKKNRPSGVKKREMEERQKQVARYQFCLFDNSIEKVANYNIEPPGVFRGRGEHPHAGRVKSRIVPEYVTINIGYDDVIPPCPIAGHAWKKVTNNTAATWLCNFKDEQNTYSASGKYLFLAAESKLKGLTDKKKYERARRLKACIDKVREDYVKSMNSNSHESNQLGVATYLVDKLALRVGNDKGTDEADTVGCCSLRVEHITLTDEGYKVTFDFLGKDSMRYFNTVEVTPLVYKLMKRFTMKGDVAKLIPKDKGEDFFDSINASKLNDYLKLHMSDLSAKVFRTYNASITLQDQLEKKALEAKLTGDSQAEAKVKFYNDCNRDVAILCNHKKAENKNLKEQLQKMDDAMKEKKTELKELEAWRKKLNASKGKNPPDNPKNLPKAPEARIKKLKEQITAKEYERKNKKENSEVALGTSKINYMDPRITISWCKRNEVPIEKIFPKTLRSKFAWAMNNEPKWEF